MRYYWTEITTLEIEVSRKDKKIKTRLAWANQQFR